MPTMKTRCETVDQTIPWVNEDGTLNIVEGDLIEELGHPEQILTVDLIEDGRVVRYELVGQLGTEFALPKDEVKVYRYIETTED